MSWGWKFKATGVGMLEVDMGHDTGFKSMFPHLRSYRYRAEQRLYPHCFSWMYPHHSHQPRCPFRDQSKPMFMYRTLFKSRPGYQSNPKKDKNQKPNIPLIQSLRCQRVPTNRRGFAPRLLCMGLQGCTFAIPLCCWKNTPWKQESLGMEWFSSVLWHFYFLFLSDSCLAGCPKLTFLNTVWEAVSFVDVTK